MLTTCAPSSRRWARTSERPASRTGDPNDASKHQGHARLHHPRHRRRDRPGERHPARRLGSQGPLRGREHRRLAVWPQGAALHGVAERGCPAKAGPRGQPDQEANRGSAAVRPGRREPPGVRDAAPRPLRLPVHLVSGDSDMALWAIRYADEHEKWWIDLVVQDKPPAVARGKAGDRVVTEGFTEVSGPVLARRASIPAAAPADTPSHTPRILTRGALSPDSPPSTAP